MTTLSTTEAHERFSELLRRVASAKERIVLTRAGEELVAVVPIEDLALVEALEDRADVEDAREALREAREEGTTSLADLKAELAVAPPERLGDLFLKIFGPARGASLDLPPRQPHEPMDLCEHPVDRVFGRLHLEKPVNTLLDEMRGPRPGTSSEDK